MDARIRTETRYVVRLYCSECQEHNDYTFTEAPDLTPYVDKNDGNRVCSPPALWGLQCPNGCSQGYVQLPNEEGA